MKKVVGEIRRLLLEAGVCDKLRGEIDFLLGGRLGSAYLGFLDETRAGRKKHEYEEAKEEMVVLCRFDGNVEGETPFVDGKKAAVKKGANRRGETRFVIPQVPVAWPVSNKEMRGIWAVSNGCYAV